MNPLEGFLDFLSTHGNTIAGVGGIAGAIDSANDISALGNASQQFLTGLGSEMVDNTKFQGYGVTSGLGSSAVGQDGSIDLGLGLDQGWGNGHNNINAGFNYLNQAGNQNGGQSATDWNATSGNMLGQMSGPDYAGWDSMGNNLASQAGGINPNQGMYGGATQQAMNASLADPSRRQGEIFNQLMAIQNPELNRQQASQMAQEHAMGRGGIAGSQYGGTSGDAAMAMARAQAGNQAALNAMQQADKERQMFGQMASQYGQLGNQNFANMTNQQQALNNAATQYGQLGNQNWANMSNRENAFGQLAGTFGQLGNQANQIANDKAGMLSQIGAQMGQLGIDQSRLAALPMELQMKLMDLGRVNAEMSQSGQLTGQDYYSQLALGGANNNINANKVAADMKADIYSAMLNNIGGQSDQQGNAATGLFGMLKDGLDKLGLFD